MKKLVWVKTASFCPLNDKNDVVLALPYFFLNFCQYQNDVILDKIEPKRRRFGAAFKYLKRRRFGQNGVVLRHFEPYLKINKKSKRRRFVSGRNETTSFRMAACFKNDGPLFFPSSFFPVLGEGGWGRREGPRPTAFRAPEISPFTEVAAAATAMTTETATLRLAGNGLAFRTNSFPFFEQFFSISLRSENRFPLLCYL